MKLIIKRKYDKNNRLILEKRNSMSYSFEYDDNNNLIHYLEWNHNTGEIITNITKEYDKNKNIIHYSDTANLIDYKCKYDKNNRLIEQIYEDGSIIFEYDDHGNILKEIDDEDCTIRRKYINIYDQNIPDIELKDDFIKIRSYDENNNLLDEIASHYHIQYKYDQNGNKIYYTDLENHIEKYKYDQNGNLVYKLEKNNILDDETTYFNNKEIICKSKDDIYIYLYDDHGNVQYQLNKFGEIEVEYINEYKD